VPTVGVPPTNNGKDAVASTHIGTSLPTKHTAATVFPLLHSRVFEVEHAPKIGLMSGLLHWDNNNKSNNPTIKFSDLKRIEPCASRGSGAVVVEQSDDEDGASDGSTVQQKKPETTEMSQEKAASIGKSLEKNSADLKEGVVPIGEEKTLGSTDNQEPKESTALEQSNDNGGASEGSTVQQKKLENKVMSQEKAASICESPEKNSADLKEGVGAIGEEKTPGSKDNEEPKELPAPSEQYQETQVPPEQKQETQAPPERNQETIEEKKGNYAETHVPKGSPARQVARIIGDEEAQESRDNQQPTETKEPSKQHTEVGEQNKRSHSEVTLCEDSVSQPAKRQRGETELVMALV